MLHAFVWLIESIHSAIWLCFVGEGERSQGRKPRSKEDEERAEQRAEERRKLDAERAEDEKKMTLAQYKEQQKEIKEKDAPKFNLRKPGEGEDQSWLKKVTVVNESKKAHVEQQVGVFRASEQRLLCEIILNF